MILAFSKSDTDCTDILFIELSELINQQTSQAINLINESTNKLNQPIREDL
jgi:hypothetical protein